jgi:hypothetical protein
VAISGDESFLVFLFLNEHPHSSHFIIIFGISNGKSSTVGRNSAREAFLGENISFQILRMSPEIKVF